MLKGRERKHFRSSPMNRTGLLWLLKKFYIAHWFFGLFIVFYSYLIFCVLFDGFLSHILRGNLLNVCDAFWQSGLLLLIPAI